MWLGVGLVSHQGIWWQPIWPSPLQPLARYCLVCDDMVRGKLEGPLAIELKLVPHRRCHLNSTAYKSSFSSRPQPRKGPVRAPGQGIIIYTILDPLPWTLGLHNIKSGGIKLLESGIYWKEKHCGVRKERRSGVKCTVSHQCKHFIHTMPARDWCCTVATIAMECWTAWKVGVNKFGSQAKRILET